MVFEQGKQGDQRCVLGTESRLVAITGLEKEQGCI